MENFEENPFENRPFEEEALEDSSENAPSQEVSAYEGMIFEQFDKSKLSLVSGLGFVILAVFYYFVIVPQGSIEVYLLSVAGMIVSSMVALFYMLDDLVFRPQFITERGAHFISGIFLGFLLLLAFLTVMTFKDNYAISFSIFVTIILAHINVALFLYSMLWEE